MRSLSLSSIILYSLLVVLAPWNFAYSEEENPEKIEFNTQVELELVEQKVEEAVVKEHAGKVLITLKDNVRFEIPEPSLTEMDAFETLPEEKKLVFHYKRIQFLTQIARVLTATKFALGMGSLAGEKISFIKTNFKKALGKEVPPVLNLESPTFSERSRWAAENTLLAIDKQLWQQAKLFVNSNEYGVSASISMVAMAGAGSRGFGGAQELGVSFTVNKEQKAFVFEIFHSSEAFKSSITSVAILAGTVKAGFVINKREVGAEGFNFKGTTYGPPSVPGYINAGKESFGAGGMLTVGLPTTPIADMLEFRNSFERNSLLRISVSPLLPGFVRLEIGNLAGSKKLFFSPFQQIYSYLKNKVQEMQNTPKGIAYCGKAFAN